MPEYNRTLTMHYHIWTRSGLAYHFRPKPYASRSAANKAARKLRTDARDRLVLACDRCPPRVPPRPARRLGVVAADLGVPVGVLRAALKRERASRPARANGNGAPSAAPAPAGDATPAEARRIMAEIRAVTR